MIQKLSKTRDLITENSISKALFRLEEISKSYSLRYTNEIILHISNHNQIKEDTRKGLLSNREKTRRENQLKNAILFLINEIEKTSNLGDSAKEYFRNSQTFIVQGDYIHKEDKSMHQTGDNIGGDKKVINMGDNNHIDGNLFIADEINSSFNQIDSSDMNNELKTLLKELYSEASIVAEQLTEEKAKNLKNDIDNLSKEVQKENPEKRRWTFSIEGIREAAKSVGEVGIKMATTIVSIIKILGEI